MWISVRIFKKILKAVQFHFGNCFYNCIFSLSLTSLSILMANIERFVLFIFKHSSYNSFYVLSAQYQSFNMTFLMILQWMMVLVLQTLVDLVVECVEYNSSFGSFDRRNLVFLLQFDIFSMMFFLFKTLISNISYLYLI